MRQRSLSSVGVVVVGIVPAIAGGPVFAAVFAILCLIGYQEYLAIGARIGKRPFRTGYLLIAAFAIAAFAGASAQIMLGLVALGIGAPLVLAVLRADAESAIIDWALATAGTFYLSLPLAAAVAIRGAEGAIDAAWLHDLAGWAALGWDAAPRGLAWLLLIISITWLGDTAAYLLGRAVGRRPLIPRVSPKKTVEGAIGGLAGSALAGALGGALFGLGLHPAYGAIIGLALGVVGQIGDLAESLLKRQAGVKDSGALIPGHGGILDRIDALLFTFTSGWFVLAFVDRLTQ